VRLFVAIDLDDDARRRVVAEQRRVARILAPFQPALAWTRIDQIHLTLAFLGEVQGDQVSGVIEAMERPIGGWAPFAVVFGGFGVFPPRGAPRVLWLGLLSGSAEVIGIQRVVAERLAGLGLPGEARPFHPHLTLARWRNSRPSDRRLVPQVESHDGVAQVRVEAVTLYESRVSSSGRAYTALARARLE
jgi:2'-5' RNA ligase